MKKNTMYILGGVAVVGLAYYLYNQNKKSSITITAPGFANLSGGDCTACGGGFNYKTIKYIDPYSGKELVNTVCVACSGTTK